MHSKLNLKGFLDCGYRSTLDDILNVKVKNLNFVQICELTIKLHLENSISSHDLDLIVSYLEENNTSIKLRNNEDYYFSNERIFKKCGDEYVFLKNGKINEFHLLMRGR